MPVRSLNSVVLKWPDREAVLAAARQWASQLREQEASVGQVLCVGSYARGDWGVGSDLDVIVRLTECDLSPARRYERFYPSGLPVHADVWVYTDSEWDSLAQRSVHLWRRIQGEAIDLLGEE